MPQPAADSRVKSIETDANLIKASLLLYYATNQQSYLDDAAARYDAARKFYLDARVPLYTVHVIDDGTQCTQVDRRFFASVNGDMIWNGLQLSRLTGQQHYHDEALATARAVDSNLSDSRGVFADLQGENDVVEPLVEAMFDLAAHERMSFAREWLLRNAAAALAARNPDGTFPRFFDGPSQSVTSIWESNGGLALEIAAAALNPDGIAAETDAWDDGESIGDPITTLPATIAFYGSGIALVGTATKAVQKQHVRVFVDGVETFDRTGLWQNASMPNKDSVLFAWRWPEPGAHTIRLEPGDPSQAGTELVHLESYVQAVQPAVPTAGEK
jgi:hypothetical protein